jgi:hypothetical protein
VSLSLIGNAWRRLLEVGCQGSRESGWGLVDLVGIEPTTSSMPWKRAPSCATGPREDTTIALRMTSIIFADRTEIVNAIEFLPCLPQPFSAIIDRARHLHNFPITI